MRLLKFVARKSLLAFGYPKLETSHPELGVYEVGAIRARMIPELPACQFFYPLVQHYDDAASTTRTTRTKNKNKNKKKNRKKNRNKNNDTETNGFVPYYRKEAVAGLLDSLNGFGDGIMQILQEAPHPLGETNYGADPLPATKTTKPKKSSSAATTSSSSSTSSTIPTNQFPLVVVSHGLTGTMEMYTQLCSQIASTGCVVVAVEHEDGSASFAQQAFKSGGSEQEQEHEHKQLLGIPYKRPDPKIPYTRQSALDFRTPMLQQRVKELQRICDHFGNYHNNINNNNDDCNTVDENDNDDEEQRQRQRRLVLQNIVAITDPSRLHLVGHSFGGATQLLAAQTWAKQKEQQYAAAAARVAVTGSAVFGNEIEDEGSPVALLTRERTTERQQRPPQPPPSPLSITVFDAWNTVLSDDVLRTGLGGVPSCFSSSSDPHSWSSSSDPATTTTAPPLEILSVLSEEWATTNPERDYTLEFLRNSCIGDDDDKVRVRSCYARDSVHQSVSDTESYVPSWAAQRIGNRGKGEPRHRTIRALVGAVAGFATATTSYDDSDSDNKNNDTVLVQFPLH